MATIKCHARFTGATTSAQRIARVCISGPYEILTDTPLEQDGFMDSRGDVFLAPAFLNT